MKTERLLSVLVALAMAGCAQNEIIESAPEADRTIRFDVYTGVQARGTETTTTSIKTLNFGILAYKTTSAGWNSDGATATPDWMYNEKATYDGSKWSYTNIKYWPTNTDKISFFAYAPYDDDATDVGIELQAITETGDPQITFTQKTAAADLVDLVVAEAKDKAFDPEAGSGGIHPNDNKVAFTFSHVLTKIDVKAKLVASYGSDTKIVITGLKLKSNAKLYKKATYKMATGKWDYTSSAEAWGNESLDLSAIIDKSNAASWTYTANQGKELTTTGTTVFSTPSGGTQHFLYMIPVRDDQTASQGLATAGDAQLEVTYDIVTKVGDGSSCAKSSTTKTVKLPAGAFEKGKSTAYTLKVGLNAIELGDVTVGIWTNGTDSDIDVK